LPNLLRCLLTLIVVAAAVFDLRFRRVPNWLTLSALFAGIGTNSFLFKGAGLLLSLEGLGLACLVYLPLYLLRGIGAGDVKLMAAIGAVVGPANWLLIFVLTAFLGGLTALLLAASKNRLRQTFNNIALILVRLRHGQAPYASTSELDVRTGQGMRLPHAVIIACGALMFLLARNRLGLR
jgi:prepilin peptidase CpaA